jgi:hypothetical protein
MIFNLEGSRIASFFFHVEWYPYFFFKENIGIKSRRLFEFGEQKILLMTGISKTIKKS